MIQKYLNVLPQCLSISDLDDLIEVLVVWYAKRAHPILMPPFLEVLLKGTPGCNMKGLAVRGIIHYYHRYNNVR
jgi:hypothetical protein